MGGREGGREGGEENERSEKVNNGVSRQLHHAKKSRQTTEQTCN